VKLAKTGNEAESQTPTPYAVRCRDGCNKGGLVYLTPECYEVQMNHPDSTWSCPRCGSHDALWDDDNYEDYLNSLGPEPEGD